MTDLGSNLSQPGSSSSLHLAFLMVAVIDEAFTWAYRAEHRVAYEYS